MLGRGGDRGQLGPRAQPELGEDMLEMSLHRVAGQEQPAGDLRVGMTLGRERHDSPLALCERRPSHVVGPGHRGPGPLRRGGPGRRDVVDEADDRLHDRLPVAGPGQVVPAGNDPQDGAGDRVGYSPGVSQRDHVLLAVHDKRRHLQSGEQVANVGAAHGLDQRRRHPRAGRSPLEGPGGIAAYRAGQAGSDQLEQIPLAPAADDRAVPAQQAGPRTPVGGAVQDQAENPARVRSRERDGATASVRDPEHHRRLRSGGIHHRGQIHHPLVHARQRVGRVGQAGAPFIKTDHPARMLQRGHEPAVAQLLPLQIQVRHQPRHEHQVTRAFTGDLIGDLGPSRLGIAGGRHTASHTDMIHHPRRYLPVTHRPHPSAGKGFCARSIDLDVVPAHV